MRYLYKTKQLNLAYVYFFIISFCLAQNAGAQVKTGLELLFSHNMDLLQNKNIGVISNHTARFQNGTHLIDSLVKINDIKVKSLFAPEHGLRGNAPAGVEIVDGIDQKTGLKVFSLYGKNKKPSPEMLQEIEILLFDIQDIGARFYTYISTLYYCMEACGENNIQIIVLDRPNPIGGINVDGPILQNEFRSFVGISEIPIIHGMTIGELAGIFADQISNKSNIRIDLEVLRIEGWNRNQLFDDTGLLWISPSPNMPNLETALVYPGVCLIEGTNISEGRGTEAPFLKVGAPWINSKMLVNELLKNEYAGIKVIPTEFKPRSIKGKAYKPKYENKTCNGIEIKIQEKTSIKSIEFVIDLLTAIQKLWPEKLEFRDSFFDKLWGSSTFRLMILNGDGAEKIISSYQNELELFEKIRKRYLLY